MLSTISQLELCSVMMTFISKTFFFNNWPEQRGRMAFHSMYSLLKKKKKKRMVIW